MSKTIDLAKVNLSGKGLFWTGVAMTAVLVLYGVAVFGAGKVGDIIKGATSGAGDTAEEMF